MREKLICLFLGLAVIGNSVCTKTTLEDLSSTWKRLAPFLSCSQKNIDTCQSSPSLANYWKSKELNFVDASVRTKREAVLDSCQDLLSTYGGRAADFISCATNYSRPILLCEKCIDYYLRASEAYRKYSTAIDDDGLSCQDVVYGSDLVQVAQRISQFIEGLWSESNCLYCFESYSIKDDTVVYTFSSGLITFMQKHRNLTNCFNASGFVVNHQDNGFSNLTNSSVVCLQCYRFYKDLTDFFLKNYTEDISKTCMDVVDAMNQTRRMWGRYFHCQQGDHSMFLVWTVAIVIFLTTIVFYIGMFFNSTFEAYIIRKQDRLEGPQNFGSLNRGYSSADLSYAPL